MNRLNILLGYIALNLIASILTIIKYSFMVCVLLTILNSLFFMLIQEVAEIPYSFTTESELLSF
jgi:hypothetical protein